MNIASSHQRQKTDILKLEDRLRCCQHDYSETKKYSKSLEQDLARKEDALSRSQAELRATKEEVTCKVDEVNTQNSQGCLVFDLFTDWLPHYICRLCKGITSSRQ